MSAAVVYCGSKRRSLFEELPDPWAPLSNKRRRRSSYKPAIGFSASPYLLDQLRSLFPDMDPQVVLERALEESGHDIDAAIKRLHELRIGGSAQGNSKNSAPAAQEQPHDTSTSTAMSNDAAEAAPSFENENMMLKQQIEELRRENTILKGGVRILDQRRKEYEEERNQEIQRRKEYEERNQELQHLKQLVSQYKEQLTTLEVNNYALTMHLKEAQQTKSIPGRFHPDIC